VISKKKEIFFDDFSSAERCMVNPWMSIEFLMDVRINHGYPSNSWMFMDFSDKHSSMSAKTHLES
jgi:hypothetical protein